MKSMARVAIGIILRLNPDTDQSRWSAKLPHPQWMRLQERASDWPGQGRL